MRFSSVVLLFTAGVLALPKPQDDMDGMPGMAHTTPAPMPGMDMRIVARQHTDENGNVHPGFAAATAGPLKARHDACLYRRHDGDGPCPQKRDEPKPMDHHNMQMPTSASTSTPTSKPMQGMPGMDMRIVARDHTDENGNVHPGFAAATAAPLRVRHDACLLKTKRHDGDGPCPQKRHDPSADEKQNMNEEERIKQSYMESGTPIAPNAVPTRPTKRQE